MEELPQLQTKAAKLRNAQSVIIHNLTIKNG